ncbi:unnamed protein product, partial [Adineta steineri]
MIHCFFYQKLNNISVVLVENATEYITVTYGSPPKEYTDDYGNDTANSSSSSEIYESGNSESTYTYSKNETSSDLDTQPVSYFVAPNCSDSNFIGLSCNISSQPCDIYKPCQNLGICTNNLTYPLGYTCFCQSGFSG